MNNRPKGTKARTFLKERALRETYGVISGLSVSFERIRRGSRAESKRFKHNDDSHA